VSAILSLNGWCFLRLTESAQAVTSLHALYCTSAAAAAAAADDSMRLFRYYRKERQVLELWQWLRILQVCRREVI
jgi:hypothetical protein